MPDDDARPDDPTRPHRAAGGTAPLLLLIAIFAGAALLVNPAGEFPLNDDWTYTRTTFRLAADGVLEVEPFAAMSLVGQALYGAAITRVAGESFLALRVSSLLLAAATAWILWGMLARLGVPTAPRAVIVLGWLFNPIYFCLGFTFMTEIPFLFFVVLGLALLLRWADTGSLAALCLSAAALGYALLIRQSGLLFSSAAILALISHRRPPDNPHRNTPLILYAAITVAFAAAYATWLSLSGSPSPATVRKFELLRFYDVEQFGANLFGLLAYVAFMTLPAIAYLAAGVPSRLRQKGTRFASTLLAWTLGVGALYAAYAIGLSRLVETATRAYRPRMPFLRNILYDCGLGPLTLAKVPESPPSTPAPPLFWIAATVAVLLALALLGTLLTLEARRRGRRTAPPEPAGAAALAWRLGSIAFLLVLAFENVFSPVEDGGMFDRHVLSAVPPLLLALAPLFRPGPAAPPRARALALAGPVLLVFAAFSIAGTHDYLAWNRVRWEAARALMARGHDPLHIAAGFEFSGWHCYDRSPPTARRENGEGWWSRDPEVIIAMRERPGWRAAERPTYRSWLHRRPIPLLVLQPTGAPPGGPGDEPGGAGSPARPGGQKNH